MAGPDGVQDRGRGLTIDLDYRLKWRAIWPVLRALPADQPLSLLDAGCGAGAWALRIAHLRPSWRIVGIDRDASSVRRAQAAARAAALPNVHFREGDFLDAPQAAYDIVLSIASVHYAAAEGRTVEVLGAMAAALAPGGRLVLLTPRRSIDQPLWRSLPRPQGWPVFGADELRAAASGAGLSVRELRGLFGSWCVLGKQAAMWAGASRIRRVFSLPIEMAVGAAPFDLVRRPEAKSYALMLVAASMSPAP